MTGTATKIRHTATEVEQTENVNSAAFGGTSGEPLVS
ncbi:hypothetical protein F4560_000790 [Saccharothrix ecbatanensis]|uniref:Uncharacterized protein n=1 Tax=Saccharothrix ecbatanensis TaxID=1105145 RepID=A0A7W9HEX7_9PSEU|nr:hypothetical protein [Saccharothrix ecbatanensis]